MQFLSTIEEMALERGAKETYQQNIIDLLKARFNSLPEGLEEALKKIDDLPRLKQLLIETIKINSVAEFEKLVNNNVSG